MPTRRLASATTSSRLGLWTTQQQRVTGRGPHLSLLSFFDPPADSRTSRDGCVTGGSGGVAPTAAAAEATTRTRKQRKETMRRDAREHRPVVPCSRALHYDVEKHHSG